MMKRLLFLLAVLIFSNPLLVSAETFTLTSPQVKDGATLGNDQVFAGFGCTGGNTSPALSWSNAPTGTKSFAVTVYDPDAPTGSGWWHWMVYNIPADVHELKLGAGSTDGKLLPPGSVQNRIDYGVAAFGGACPPPGDKPHRYIFTVHALKSEKLDLAPDATAALTGYMINANRIDKASFTAFYGRPALPPAK